MLVFGATNPKDHERKEIQHRGQDQDPKAGGCWPRHRGGVPRAQPLPSELLPLEEAVWANGGQ